MYTAGYLRTRTAAEKLEAASLRRFPNPASAPADVDGPPALKALGTARGGPSAPSPDTDAKISAVTMEMPTRPMPLPAAPAAVGPNAAVATPAAASAPATSKPAAPTAAGDVNATAAMAAPSGGATGIATAPAVATSAAPPATADAAAPAPSAATPASAAEAAAPVAPRGKYAKDGTYSGWGTSRHGDIEATVIIENGRIVSAKISQCLTRYSCSWIDPLPPQVLARQNAEVDYVSGATQSTYAFYYALTEALAKAK